MAMAFTAKQRLSQDGQTMAREELVEPVAEAEASAPTGKRLSSSSTIPLVDASGCGAACKTTSNFQF